MLAYVRTLNLMQRCLITLVQLYRYRRKLFGLRPRLPDLIKNEYFPRSKLLTRKLSTNYFKIIIPNS